MRFDVLTLFPEMVEGYFEHSIMKRARDKGLIEINTINPRDFTEDKHKKVDDTPYGGGSGMVLMVQPYVDAYESIELMPKSRTIMLTPQGKPFDEKMCRGFAQMDQLVLLCGHYEGFDERIRNIIKPIEVSIGDFVLTGGELPALCLIDAISRKIKGVLGRIASADEDSFSNGLLEYPHYTKPREYRGYKVPDVLLNGNHSEISRFRMAESLRRTQLKRADLLYEFEKLQNPYDFI